MPYPRVGKLVNILISSHLQHTFEVNMFSEFERSENIPDEWEPPTEEPYASQGNRKSHLLEPDACDQFGLVYEGGDKETQTLFWNL